MLYFRNFTGRQTNICKLLFSIVDLICEHREQILEQNPNVSDHVSTVSSKNHTHVKTKTAQRIGALRHSDVNFCPEYNFKWTNNFVAALGVTFASNPQLVMKLNFLPELQNIELTLNNWQRRDLSLIGKITILKSLALSKLTFFVTVLPKPDNFFFD